MRRLKATLRLSARLFREVLSAIGECLSLVPRLLEELLLNWVPPVLVIWFVRTSSGGFPFDFLEAVTIGGVVTYNVLRIVLMDPGTQFDPLRPSWQRRWARRAYKRVVSAVDAEVEAYERREAQAGDVELAGPEANAGDLSPAPLDTVD